MGLVNDWIFSVADTFLDNKILWVGPGMGDIMYHGPWPAAISVLTTSEDPVKISHLKLLDIQGIPKQLFGNEYAMQLGMELQESEQGDFFQESNYWDIVILDRIEAWLLGRHYWPTLAKTPYEVIAHEWEEALKKLRPYQVWVRHDGILNSTIIPNLAPEYELVVNIQNIMRGYYFHEKDILVTGNASFWSEKALMLMKEHTLATSGAFGSFDSQLHVWQLK